MVCLDLYFLWNCIIDIYYCWKKAFLILIDTANLLFVVILCFFFFAFLVFFLVLVIMLISLEYLTGAYSI